MTLKRNPDPAHQERVTLTACPKCGKDIAPPKNFPRHWRTECEYNNGREDATDD